MYLENIEIDGVRTDNDQFFRILRIHRIIGYAQALADINNNKNFIEKVKSFYDHKGLLIINWKSEPTESKKEYLQKSWNSIIADYEDNPIKHQFKI